MTANSNEKTPKTFQDMTLREIEEALKETNVAMITCAQIAQHGPHLPISTDLHQLREVARLTIQKLGQIGYRVIAGPEVPYGLSPTHLDFIGHLHLQPETLTNLLVDLGDSLINQGFTRLILLNGAGGNWSSLENAVYHLGRKHEDAKIILLGWFETIMGVVDQLTENTGRGAGKDGHGGAWETSCVLAVAPHLVDMEKAEENYPDLAQEMSSLPFVNVNWNDQARLIGLRSISEISENGMWGNAAIATAKAGHQLMDHASTVLSTHIAKYIFGHDSQKTES